MLRACATPATKLTGIDTIATSEIVLHHLVGGRLDRVGDGVPGEGHRPREERDRHEECDRARRNAAAHPPDEQPTRDHEREQGADAAEAEVDRGVERRRFGDLVGVRDAVARVGIGRLEQQHDGEEVHEPR